MSNQILSDGTITLRAIEVTDVDTIMAWENDSSQWNSTSTIAPFSRKQLWDYAVNYDGDIFQSGNIRFMVIESKSGESIGTVDIFDFDKFHNRASIGMYIAPQFRGNGYSELAVNIAVGYCCDFLGMKQIVAEVASDNLSSIKMLTHCGFAKCGEMKCWFRRGKRYVDATLMQHLA